MNIVNFEHKGVVIDFRTPLTRFASGDTFMALVEITTRQKSPGCLVM